MAVIQSRRAKTKRRVYVVYLIRNLLDRKRYIGKTSGRSAAAAVEARWRKHLSSALDGAGWRLARAMRKHGAQNFVIGHLHICKTERGAFELEKMEIARLAPEYNMTSGGEGVAGYRWTQEQLAAVRGSRRERLLGKAKTPEHAHNISLGKKGKPYKRINLTPTMIARKTAREAGLKVYSGAPCKQGHTSRYVSTRQCCECHRLRHLESIGGTYRGQGNRTPRSTEFRAAVSRALTGRQKTSETRAKMAVAAKLREAARREKKEIEQCQMTL